MLTRIAGLRAAVLAALLVLSIAPPLAAQIKLFPDVLPEPERPAAPGTDTPGAPESAPAFQVEDLDALEVDAIGLEDGFPPEVFEGAELALVEPLLEGLPARVDLPAQRDLARRILITSADVEGAEGALLAPRIRGLLAIGDLRSAEALAARLPPMTRDSDLARLATDVALLAGDDDRACATTNAIAPESDAAYWARLTVFCRLLEGDQGGASLAVDLLREAGDDPVTLAVADVALTGDPGRPLPALRDPEPIHLALLRIEGHPVPREVLVDPAPAILAALASTPGLELPLDLAERALLIDALEPADLADRYANATGEGSLAAPGERGAEARAGAWQRFEAAGDASERAAIVDEVWQATSGATRFVVAETFGPAVVDLPVDAQLLAPAPSLTRVFLARGQMVPAARWFSLLRERGDPAAAAGLAPLFAMAGVGGAGEVPVPDARTIDAWAGTRDQPSADLPLLLALLEGSGAPVADEVWWTGLQSPLIRPAAAPLPALHVAAARTTERGRRGEAILASLALFGDDPIAAPPEALMEALRTLRATGFEAEARRIAVQTALLAGY